jgi:hypothetical protein
MEGTMGSKPSGMPYDEAELRAELAELTAKNEAATSWGAAVGARSERIKAINGLLSRGERKFANGLTLHEYWKIRRKMES